MWMTEDEGMFSDASVGSGVDGEEATERALAVRCFPACTRRMSDVGAEVRRDRRCWRVERDVSEGIVNGIAAQYLAHFCA